MYNTDINNAISAAKAQAETLMSKALSQPITKGGMSDEAKEVALVQEGFRPIVTPEKDVKWIPRPKPATSTIQSFQKGLSSMSIETLANRYPLLQYAEKNFHPVIDAIIEGVQKGDYSMQYLYEIIGKFTKEGISEAIKNTGGMKEQGKGMLANSDGAAESGAILANSVKAYKEIATLSKYAQNGYSDVTGGDDGE